MYVHRNGWLIHGTPRVIAQAYAPMTAIMLAAMPKATQSTFLMPLPSTAQEPQMLALVERCAFAIVSLPIPSPH